MTPGYAISCECIHPLTLGDAGWSYAFKGRVTHIERIEENNRAQEIVMFEVLENITDVKSKVQKVIFRKGYDICDIEEPYFAIGDIYTITSMGNIETNLLYNNYCNLRLKHE